MVPVINTILQFEWNLKDICKNKLSKKDAYTILGFCVLKKCCFFSIVLQKKDFLNEVSQ